MWYSAHMDTIVYIVGPTGSGKTNLATHLAKSFSGNLISADSIQVYKGLDIVSGKDIDQDSQFIEHTKIKSLSIGTHTISGVLTYLLDIVDPSYLFHVSDYYRCAHEAVKIVRKSGNFPMVVGGTTLYINSLLHPIATIDIPANLQLREKLESNTLEELRITLEKLSPAQYNSLNNSELGNRRRIIRKIEIASDSSIQTHQHAIPQKAIVIGLYCSKEELNKRIDERVEQRILYGGFEEVEGLFKKYSVLSPQVKSANGYKQLFSYFKGEYSKEESIKRWKYSEYRHAKNQMTYFKKYASAQWFDVEKKDYIKKIMDFVLDSGLPSK